MAIKSEWQKLWDEKRDELRQERWDDEAKVLFGDWIKAGYDEDGRLIQYNKKTKEIRKLEKWVEIHRTSVKHFPKAVRDAFDEIEDV